MRTYKFVAALHMFSDVLPPPASLSRATIAKPLVQWTKPAVETLCGAPGEFFTAIFKLAMYGV